MNVIRLLKKIKILLGKVIIIYRRLFWSLEKQAIHAGVEIGSDNFIASRFWSSEPYI